MQIVLAAIRYPPAPGGAETHVAALAKRYHAMGHDVIVHTSDLFTEYPFARRDLPTLVDGVRIVRHRARRVANAWTMMPTMARALRADARGADVVHAHSYGYHQTVVAAREAKRANVPFVFTPHYHPPWSMEGGAWRKALRSAFDPLVGQRVVDAAEKVIAVSSGELAEMRRHLRVPHATVIPNGFDAERYQTVPDGAPFRAKLGLRDDEPLVLFAGRLASNKGLPTLLDAFAKLRADARLVLAGQDQGWRARLEAQARALGIAARVQFAGHLDDASYRSALAAADVLALPSEWEAFGIVLAEAAACETPVVATRVGGAPDVVVDGETGSLVPYGDASALADALARVLADGALAARLGHAARVRAMREYAWDAVAQKTLAVYRDMNGVRGVGFEPTTD